MGVVAHPELEGAAFGKIAESESGADGNREGVVVVEHGILEENLVDIPAAALPPVIDAGFFNIGGGDAIDGAEASDVVAEGVEERFAGLTREQGAIGDRVRLNVAEIKTALELRIKRTAGQVVNRAVCVETHSDSIIDWGW